MIGNDLRRRRVQRAKPHRQRAALCGQRKVGFRHHDQIGHGDLLHGFELAVQRGPAIGRIHHADHAIKVEIGLQIWIKDEGLQDRPRIGHARCFDDDAGEIQFPGAAARGQIAHRAPQIAAHRAAQTPRSQKHHGFRGAFDQVMVQPDLAEFVHDHGYPLHAGMPEERVEKCGLSGAQKAGQQGYGQGLCHGCIRSGMPSYRPAGAGASAPWRDHPAVTPPSLRFGPVFGMDCPEIGDKHEH